LYSARFSYNPKTEVFKGVIYTINRSEFLFSRPNYSQRLNIPDNRVRKAIELLIKDNMIEVVSSLGKNKPTIYKIINYDLYNNPPSESVGAQRLQELSTKSPPSDHQVTTKSPPLKKKEKIDKNEKKSNTPKQVYEEESTFYKLSNYFYKRLLDNNPGHNKPNLQNWSNDIRLMMEQDKRSEEQIRYLIDWVQNDNFEMPNVQSPSKLRKRFDSLIVKVKNEQPKKVPKKTEFDLSD